MTVMDLTELKKQAGQLLYQQKWNESIAALTEIISVMPNNPEKAEVYNNRGSAYANKGEQKLAIADYNKAIELDSNYAMAHSNRGVAYGKKGEHELAIADMSKAIELKPDDAEACNNRGVAYKNKGDYDLAIADLDKAIKLKPDYADAYNNRGIVHSKKGEHDLAIADLDKAIELKPDDAEMYNNRGIVHKGKGNYDFAIADYDEAIKIDPKCANAYNNRGLARGKNGEYDLAIADFDKAIEINSGDKSAIHNRGVAMALKDAKAARTEIEEQYKKQAESDQKKFEQTLEKYRSDILGRGGYKQRASRYDDAFKRVDADIAAKTQRLQKLAIWIFGTIGGVGVFIWLAAKPTSAFWLLPFVTLGALVLAPFWWEIRLLNCDKTKVWALREDAYTKGVLATLIDVDKESRAERVNRFFDHHDRRGSAQLILDSESARKDDGVAERMINVIRSGDGKKE